MKKSILGKCALVIIVASTLCATAHASSMLYVSDTFGGNVHVIDTSDNLEVGDPIPVSHDHLLPPVVSPDGQFVYVQSTDGAISVIDTSLHAVARTFENPNQGPETTDARPSMTLSPDGRTLYAIAADSSAIARIDTSTGAVVSHIDATSARDLTPVIRASHGTRVPADVVSSGVSAVDELTVARERFGLIENRLYTLDPIVVRWYVVFTRRANAAVLRMQRLQAMTLPADAQAIVNLARGTKMDVLGLNDMLQKIADDAETRENVQQRVDQHVELSKAYNALVT